MSTTLQRQTHHYCRRRANLHHFAAATGFERRLQCRYLVSATLTLPTTIGLSGGRTLVTTVRNSGQALATLLHCARMPPLYLCTAWNITFRRLLKIVAPDHHAVGTRLNALGSV